MSKKPLKIDDQPSAAPKSDAKREAQEVPDHIPPKEYARALVSRLLFMDLIIAFGMSFWMMNKGFADPDFTKLGVAALGALFFIFALSSLKSYDIRNLNRMYLTISNIVKALIGWVVVTYAATQFIAISVPILPTAGALAASLIFWRMAALVFGILQQSVRRRLRSRVVIVGWTSMVAQMIEATASDYTADFEVIGCIPLPDGTFTEQPPTRVPVLGRYMTLLNLIAQRRIDSVILADHLSPDEFQGLAAVCQRSYIDFHVVPSGFPTLRSCLDIQIVGGIPVVGYGSLPLDRVGNRIMKRTMDIVGGFIGLLLASPLITIFSILVYLESPGPVFYKQRRSTRGGQSFYIYKIRSMKLNAEANSGAVWCKKEDDRRLRIGALMRKTNVDELPQFWNVLKGDMSLVGPRPERPELISQFKHRIENYNTRHMAKAGLTGWAAINGWRGDTDLNRRIEADIYYLENWSLSLDLYCIFATFFKIKNAY